MMERGFAGERWSAEGPWQTTIPIKEGYVLGKRGH